jgi:hypothetical protein
VLDSTEEETMPSGRPLAAVLAAFTTAGCTAPERDVLDEETFAHTTTTPGRTAWVRMLGGVGIQRWHVVDAHEASRLTWVMGLSDRATQVAAYDPFGARVVEEQYTLGDFGFDDIAAGEDDSRTMTRAGEPDGFGCEPGVEAAVTEIGNLTFDGTCRWLHSFALEPDATPRFEVAAGLAGTVVIAGHTRKALAFGDDTLGEDVPDLGFLPAAFVARLDAETGAVIWHESLGHGQIEDVAVDGGDRVIVAIHTSFSGGWSVRALDADGNERWHRTLPQSVLSVSLAGSPAGEVVAAGTYRGAFSLVGATLPDSGSTNTGYIVRFRAGTGNTAAGIRAGGTAQTSINGVDVDHHGKVVVAGGFSGGTLTIRSFSFTGSGLKGRAWAAELTPQLDTARWARAFGNDTAGETIGFRGAGYTNTSRAMLAGEFHGTFDFGSGQTRTGSNAAVLVRIYP